MSTPKSCGFCGKPFIGRSESSTFCSPACRNKARSKRGNASCLVCGQVFQPRTQGAKFCSRECMGLARRTGTTLHTKSCEWCGKVFATELKRSRFCSASCSAKNQWETRDRGRGFHLQNGYKIANINGEWVREHKYVAEQMLGRRLMVGEVVHHKNGIKTDNRPENLEVLDSQADHMLRHPRDEQGKMANGDNIIIQTVNELPRGN